MNEVNLFWHNYRYYPYEKVLALREIQSLLNASSVNDVSNGLHVKFSGDSSLAERLVYFSEIWAGGKGQLTKQAVLERGSGNGINRQSTRYSSHGLHEYKGKFNPQVARAILNIFQIAPGSSVLDPFCGSGTSLIECSHLGISSFGVDINPLAVFIANAKISALKIPTDSLLKSAESVTLKAKRLKIDKEFPSTERGVYLGKWFENGILDSIERLRLAIADLDEYVANILFSIASNLLREYSLQDPNDLRIRRRKSPLPEKPFYQAFVESVQNIVPRLKETQTAIPKANVDSKAFVLDSRYIHHDSVLGKAKFDCVITSPPYATALPYIDTQRLSLIWLGLIPPSAILRLEADLIGSREVRGQSKKALVDEMSKNKAGLSDDQVKYCQELQEAVLPSDGFRRQAVPMLLYRYFSGMIDVFRSVRKCVRCKAPFALIVGGNHTTLGGKRFDIDTPKHLAKIAEEAGWKHEETVELQTYQRYGYHMGNAVRSEDLVIVRAK